jgi:hypothetical protein
VVAVGPSARTVPLLRATVLALKQIDKPVRAQISKETRGTLGGAWKEAVATKAAGNRQDFAVFGKGARVAAGNPARLISTSSRRPLRKGTNGLIPNSQGRYFEFPSGDPGKYVTYTRKSADGGTHRVRRRVMAGGPVRKAGGRVVYPAVASVMPRFVSMWVQIVVRNIHESLEGK